MVVKKREIDELDIAILNYLEDDARKSLKKLADDLNKKTSTIYHRLQRLKSNDIILGYSIIFNHEYLNIKKISIEKITIKPLNISSLDGMFLKSFGEYILAEFEQTLFIALSEKEDIKTIYLISIHLTDELHAEYIDSLRKNPYIEEIESDFLSHVIKGQKLFSFNEKWVSKKVSKEKKAKQVEREEFEEEKDDEERKMAISFGDDDEEEELKF